jgi:uncharacterized protein YjbI with pentapeptide repeats
MFGANLAASALYAARFEEADLEGADLRGTILDMAHLRGAILDNARMGSLNEYSRDPQGATVSTSRLNSIKQADLSNASLKGASLRNAILWKTRLEKANLEGADLTDADLTGVDIRGAQLKNARLTKEYGSSWIFRPCLTCANALRRVQHSAFSLVTGQGLLRPAQIRILVGRRASTGKQLV